MAVKLRLTRVGSKKNPIYRVVVADSRSPRDGRFIDIDDKELARVEAIVLSMTPLERAKPVVIDGKRRLRIARGSGTSVEQVNQLLPARKQMEKMMKQMGKGKMPDLAQLQNGGQAPPGGGGRPRPSATRRSRNKRKKRSRR